MDIVCKEASGSGSDCQPSSSSLNTNGSKIYSYSLEFTGRGPSLKPFKGKVWGPGKLERELR